MRFAEHTNTSIHGQGPPCPRLFAQLVAAPTQPQSGDKQLRGERVQQPNDVLSFLLFAFLNTQGDLLDRNFNVRANRQPFFVS